MMHLNGEETQRPRILVVDDEKNIRTTLADILGDEGFEVSTAATGEKAVKMCGRQAFDVVLMDVRLPGIDGADAFRVIRRNRDGIRAIMMTAYTQDVLEREVLEEGAFAFVRKPLDMTNLLRLIREPSDKHADR